MGVEHVGQTIGVQHRSPGQDAVLSVGDEVDLRGIGCRPVPSSATALENPRRRRPGSRFIILAAWDRRASSTPPKSTACASILLAMTTEPTGHRPTLMTVHAHPDDETIGTGGAMAKAVADGRRVVLVTCTRGEMGEIVVPEHGHAREPPPARRAPGGRARGRHGRPGRHRVGEPRLPRLGHDGPARQPRPAQLLAGGPRRGGPPPGLAGPALPARRHDDVQLVRRLRPPGSHPHPRRRDPGVPAGRRSGLVPGAARARAWRHGTVGRGGRPRPVVAVEALRASHPRVRPGTDGGGARGATARRASGHRPTTRRPSRSRRWRNSPPRCSSPTSRSRPGSTSRAIRSSASGRPSTSIGPRSRRTARSC